MFYTTEIYSSQYFSLSIFSSKISKFLIIVPSLSCKPLHVVVGLLGGVQQDHLTQVPPDGGHVPAVRQPPVESPGDDLLLHGVAQAFDWN